MVPLFYDDKIMFSSTLLSIATKDVPPQFLHPDELAFIVDKLANDGILRIAKLFPLLRESNGP